MRSESPASPMWMWFAIQPWAKTPYVSRVMLHYTIPLSKETTEATRNPLSLASTVPVRRLELRVGKMSTVDFFDLNSVGSDSHLQFMNWAIVNNGAYDYAADTRGYTYGLVAEYFAKTWAARFGEMLMPTVANGIQLDWNIARARGENFEFEYHTALLPKRADRGAGACVRQSCQHGQLSAKRSTDTCRARTPVPDITLYRKQGSVKYGFGLNVEQELTPLWRAFGRLGWNDGTNESYAYTEIDRTAEIGSDFQGKPWRRRAGQSRRGIRRQRTIGRSSPLSGSGRTGFHPGRRRAQLRSRTDLRDVLHGSHLARDLGCRRLPARDESRLQPGPRPRFRREFAYPCGRRRSVRQIPLRKMIRRPLAAHARRRKLRRESEVVELLAQRVLIGLTRRLLLSRGLLLL